MLLVVIRISYMGANCLQKLIDSNLYSRYSGILTLSDIPLFLMDKEGNILLEFIPSPDFCIHICGKNIVSVCDEYKSRMCDSETTFICKYGLYNMLLPIKADGKIAGYMGGMQVYLNDDEHKKFLIDLPNIQKKTGADIEDLAKSVSAFQTASENKIKTHQQLCRHIANNISLDLADLISEGESEIKKLSIEKDILERKLIDMETKNMSLEINPHFLFNTLNSIARIAYFEKSHKTEELIYYLSDWLRYNLKQGNRLHTIGSEVDNIEKYLYIQKARFNNRLTYDIDIADSIKTYRIPNMVIQPIVENAVIHGIAPKIEGGNIKIFAESQNEKIVIYVADNGGGFPQKVLNNLHDKSEGIGLKGTDKRLRSYFGEEYGIDIIKSDFGGSTVTIPIPKKSISLDT